MNLTKINEILAADDKEARRILWDILPAMEHSFATREDCSNEVEEDLEIFLSRTEAEFATIEASFDAMLHDAPCSEICSNVCNELLATIHSAAIPMLNATRKARAMLYRGYDDKYIRE